MGTVKLKLTDSTNDVVGASCPLFLSLSAEVGSITVFLEIENGITYLHFLGL